MENVFQGHYATPKNPHLVVIGNKYDLEDERVISEEDGRKLVEKYKERFGGVMEGFECFEQSLERYLMSRNACPICSDGES